MASGITFKWERSLIEFCKKKKTKGRQIREQFKERYKEIERKN